MFWGAGFVGFKRRGDIYSPKNFPKGGVLKKQAIWWRGGNITHLSAERGVYIRVSPQNGVLKTLFGGENHISNKPPE